MPTAGRTTTSSPPVLETEALTKRFGGVTAVDSLRIKLESGKVLGVIGPNGAGKSTLVGLLSGALRPTFGVIRVQGRDVTDTPPHLRARMGVARTYQVPQPFAAMSVFDNLMIARLNGHHTHRQGAREEVDRILTRTGLAQFAAVPASELTLLRLKRLELARALAVGPRLLLLDEIGAGLVKSELVELITLLNDLRSEVESILIVEHVLDVIQECSDRVLVLDWGRKLVEGSPAQVLSDSKVAAVYLGTTAAASAPDRSAMPSDAEKLLEVRNVAVSYGRFRALHDVSLTINRGEVVTLLGANGAGKTTTARVICGMLRPDRGEIWLRGARIDGERPHRIVARGVTHCMEGRRIFGDLTVDENLLVAGRIAGSPQELRRRMERVYELFDVLRTKRDQPGGSLSGGQQQMLAIGRALMAKPELMIFDEISLGLAPVAVDRLYEALAQINESGVTMLVIEQNVERALALAHRAYVLEHGTVALHGRPAEIKNDPRLRALYVGEARGET